MFREWARASAESQRNYAIPFDVNDPVNTPRGLDPTVNAAVVQALGVAVARLTSAGIPLDARLGDIQYVTRGGVRIPIPGGTGGSGVLNIISAALSNSAGGYPDVSSGSSWIQATEFTEDGPVSRGIMTYSQTTNPSSPHFADMTQLFSQGQWVDLPFREADVAAAALASAQVVEGKQDCKNGGWQSFTHPSFPDQAACVAYYDGLRQQRLAEIAERQ